MMLHDVIKIQLSRKGYLPNYPPHLISDAEMCDAFLGYYDTSIRHKLDMFHATYPEPVGFEIPYFNLTKGMYDILQDYKLQVVDNPDAELPNWIYAYMLCTVVGPNSSEVDRHNALVLMGLDNVDDALTPEVYTRCLKISDIWLSKYEADSRPLGLFIEPHIIKYLRLTSEI